MVIAAPLNTSRQESDLATTVRLHSWAWLFQLRRRLNVDVQIVDRDGLPLLHEASEPIGGIYGQSELAGLVGRALQSHAAETTRIGDTLVTCVSLATSSQNAEGGAVVVTRALSPDSEETSETRREIELIASWLRGAADAHLATEPRAVGEEVQRLGALRRALAGGPGGPGEQIRIGSGDGSVIGLMDVFADAIAIWEDVDVRVYAETLSHEFAVRSAPAVASVEMPAVLPHTVMLNSELTRLSSQTLEQLGISSTTDVLSARLESPDGPSWVLLFAGPIDVAGSIRLALYVDVLEHFVGEAITRAQLRLHRALTRHLLSADDDLEGAAKGALDEICAAVQAEVGAFLITLPHGARALAVGKVDAFAASSGRLLDNHVSATRQLAGGGTLVVAAARSGRIWFGHHEQVILESALEAIEPWAASVLRRPGFANERRSSPRSFEQMMEEVAAEAIDRGWSVAVVVIRIEQGVFHPGLTHRLAGQIRAHLRAAEPAGALTDMEIAALLFDPKPEEVPAVIARLKRLGPSLADGEVLASASMGFAHRSAGAPHEVSVVAAARREAAKKGASPSARPE